MGELQSLLLLTKKNKKDQPAHYLFIYFLILVLSSHICQKHFDNPQDWDIILWTQN